MSKRKWLLALLTFALIISASIQPAIAYFTSFVRAVGGFEVTVGDTTTIEEEYSEDDSRKIKKRDRFKPRKEALQNNG